MIELLQAALAKAPPPKAKAATPAGKAATPTRKPSVKP
jgi:hypothetical protein